MLVTRFFSEKWERNQWIFQGTEKGFIFSVILKGGHSALCIYGWVQIRSWETGNLLLRRILISRKFQGNFKNKGRKEWRKKRKKEIEKVKKPTPSLGLGAYCKKEKKSWNIAWDWEKGLEWWINRWKIS